MKSGYGYGFPMVPFAGSRNGGFNPLNVRGLQLLLTMKNPTPASWLDQSPNAFAFNQAIVLKQPIVGALSVNYDGVDDFQRYVAPQPLNDSIGIFNFSGYFDNTTNSYYFASANSTVTDKYFAIGTQSTGEIFIQVNTGTSHDVVKSTNTIINGAYFNASIEKIGGIWELTLNGVVEVPIIVVGFNSGKWLADVTGRDGMELSILNRSGSIIYTISKQNKVLYSNLALTTAEKKDINTWMSDPNNK